MLVGAISHNLIQRSAWPSLDAVSAISQRRSCATTNAKFVSVDLGTYSTRFLCCDASQPRAPPKTPNAFLRGSPQSRAPNRPPPSAPPPLSKDSTTIIHPLFFRSTTPLSNWSYLSSRHLLRMLRLSRPANHSAALPPLASAWRHERVLHSQVSPGLLLLGGSHVHHTHHTNPVVFHAVWRRTGIILRRYDVLVHEPSERQRRKNTTNLPPVSETGARPQGNHTSEPTPQPRTYPENPPDNRQLRRSPAHCLLAGRFGLCTTSCTMPHSN